MSMRISLKLRLITSFLVVVAITGIIATGVGVRTIADRVVAQVQDKVIEDLNSAREIYREKVGEVLTIVRLTATRFFLRDCLLTNDRARLQTELETIRIAEHLDILTVTDRDGTVIVRARNPEMRGDDQAEDAIVGTVLREVRPAASTQILSSAELAKEGEELASQAHIPIVTTPMAMPLTKKEETSGMLIKAAAPVFDENHSLTGILYGAKLLNRDYEIVDKIKNTVYHDEQYKGVDIGTATIFQGDLRISTNVRDREGGRAIGTRVSREVYERVVLEGKPWFGRAFVVNDWYITAYEPIRDVTGSIVGILYVGVLEKKYADMKKSTMWLFLSVTLAGMAIAIVVSYLLATGIAKPLKRLVAATRQIAAGALDHEVESEAKDEIGELARAFNSMVSSIRERDERLREQAELQVMKAEKLAMIGRLAAGVAHEINNPLGGILLYSNLMLEDMSADDPQRETLENIVKETDRCKSIVRGLLDFARQREPNPELGRVEETIESVLLLLEQHALFHNISVEKRFDDNLPMISFDKSQMQQVFMNIILNAAESMDGDGKIRIDVTLSVDGKQVLLSFTDTGHGIPKQNLEKLFEPFFTTKKPGEGTGLGLSISYGIVRKHGGTIEVSSEVGKGTTFTVSLPVGKEGEDNQSA